MDGKDKAYCTPESYKGVSVRLWRNRGDGTFEDTTHKSGLYDATSKSLGIAIFDANQDGWPDIAISNDTQPNKLYINNRNGTFAEKGVVSGIGFSEDGVARAGMGIDAADYNHSGYPSLAITNFSNQMISLYQNQKNGLFVDIAPQSEVGRKSLLTLGFGCFFFDYDLDGWLDPTLRRCNSRSIMRRLRICFTTRAAASFRMSRPRWASPSMNGAWVAAQRMEISTMMARWT
jgi:hypothetical protein